ncbi:MAG: DUF2147 domain-containing protein [Filomicrobium sp.]
MSVTTRVIQAATVGLTVFAATSVQAASDPRGIWFDHNGRGAVEIADCENGRGLCGYVVHVKKQKYASRCGLQILGNVTSKGGGWIYSPSRGRKFTVRIKRLSDNNLRVVGNASSRFFSKTFTWKRAPEDLQLCGKYASRNNAPEKSTSEAVVEEKPVKRTERRASKVERDPLISDFVSNPKPRRYNKSKRDIEAEEEAELERNATADEEVRSNDRQAKREDDQEWGMEPEGGSEDGPVENEVTEVLDTLIDRANEYTGKLERKCKFRIPYVDRVIMIPCRD